MISAGIFADLLLRYLARYLVRLFARRAARRIVQTLWCLSFAAFVLAVVYLVATRAGVNLWSSYRLSLPGLSVPRLPRS